MVFRSFATGAGRRASGGIARFSPGCPFLRRPTLRRCSGLSRSFLLAPTSLRGLHLDNPCAPAGLAAAEERSKNEHHHNRQHRPGRSPGTATVRRAPDPRGVAPLPSRSSPSVPYALQITRLCKTFRAEEQLTRPSLKTVLA